MSVLYTISRREIGGYSEVHMRFYNGRSCDLRARTRIFVPRSAWNSDEGRCNISRRYETADNVKARAAQAQLDELAQRVTDAYAIAGGSVDRAWLQHVIDKDADAKTLPEIIDDYCITKNVAPRTRYKLHALRKHLERYEKQKRCRLYAHTLTRADLDSIVRFLRTVGALGQNAVASRMKQIRALVYFGGKPYPNPFDNYTMPQEVYGDPSFLTHEELERLTAYELLTSAKRTQRDIFVFQCHTGCRVSDLYALTYANIKDGWLVYTPQKTAHTKAPTIEIPLSPDAQRIVERYKGMDLHGRLLPFISDIKYNVAIRAVLRASGIDRPVMWRDPQTGTSRPRPLYEIASSHLARRTFAQMAYAATGDKRLAASMTGHSENSRAFNRYSEVTREMKKRALQIADILPT